jgi:transcriptional regulator with XRE-family HTH domain
MAQADGIEAVLAQVEPRLKRIRDRRDVTLAELAAVTGISKSMLSRLENGRRKPSLELLPIADAHRGEPELRTHGGQEWLYVLGGRLRLLLGDEDITLGPGEVAELDTRVPHWFGPAGDEPVEILSPLARHGHRIHARAEGRQKIADR